MRVIPKKGDCPLFMILKDKKILITGGAGFIGSHVARALLAEGAHVVIVDNFSTGRRDRVPEGATVYDINIADPHFSEIIEIERPDIIYHFAFYVLVPESLKDPLRDMDCLVGTLRMLEAARKIGVTNIVFASSGFLYGNNPHLPVKETEPIIPITPYVVSKNAIEKYLQFYALTYGMSYVSLRYAAVYGPGQVTGAMADYIRTLHRGGQADIWGDGTKTRDYVYIDDVVRANILALDVPADFSDPIFNIGTGREVTLNTVYEKIAALLRKEAHPVYHPDRPGEQMRYCLDNTKARTVLGWEPAVDFDAGVQKRVEHFLRYEQ